MNKKGFTLTELLGVIAILAVIITIAVSSYNGIQKNILEQQYQNVTSYILTGAEDYAHKNNFEPTNNTEQMIIYMNVDALIKRGIISADDDSGKIFNPKDKTEMNNMCIRIDYNSKDRSYQATFEATNTNCQGKTFPYIVRK